MPTSASRRHAAHRVSCSHPRRARGARAGRTRARPTHTAAAGHALARPARARRGSTSSTCSLGSATAPSQSITTRSPGRMLDAADDDGPSELPHLALGRALRAHEPRPDRQADRGELVEVADGAVDEDSRDAAALRLCRQQRRRRAPPAPARRSSAPGRPRRSRARRPRAPSCCRRRADRRPRRPGDAGAGHDLASAAGRRRRSGRPPRGRWQRRAGRGSRSRSQLVDDDRDLALERLCVADRRCGRRSGERDWRGARRARSSTAEGTAALPSPPWRPPSAPRRP